MITKTHLIISLIAVWAAHCGGFGNHTKKAFEIHKHSTTLVKDEHGARQQHPQIPTNFKICKICCVISRTIVKRAIVKTHNMIVKCPIVWASAIGTTVHLRGLIC
jgi:hypothetical protein